MNPAALVALDLIRLLVILYVLAAIPAGVVSPTSRLRLKEVWTTSLVPRGLWASCLVWIILGVFILAFKLGVTFFLWCWSPVDLAWDIASHTFNTGGHLAETRRRNTANRTRH